MYEYLRGRIASTGPSRAVIETQGVGWLLHVPDAVATRLRPGQETTLLVHLAVAESALTLYGFGSDLERRLFRRLIHVTGVGPTRALELMSALPAEALVRALVESDVLRLTTVKGIGRKTAERMVVELRDHLRDWAAGPAAAEGATPVADDLARVLSELGAAPPAAQRAAAQARAALGADAEFQDLLRHALRHPA